ncbi:hypothetical protein P7C70_g7114, partial [Phenoliferia sp. Uapishka_3]
MDHMHKADDAITPRPGRRGLKISLESCKPQPVTATPGAHLAFRAGITGKAGNEQSLSPSASPLTCSFESHQPLVSHSPPQVYPRSPDLDSGGEGFFQGRSAQDFFSSGNMIASTSKVTSQSSTSPPIFPQSPLTASLPISPPKLAPNLFGPIPTVFHQPFASPIHLSLFDSDWEEGEIKEPTLPSKSHHTSFSTNHSSLFNPDWELEEGEIEEAPITRITRSAAPSPSPSPFPHNHHKNSNTEGDLVLESSTLGSPTEAARITTKPSSFGPSKSPKLIGIFMPKEPYTFNVRAMRAQDRVIGVRGPFSL